MKSESEIMSIQDQSVSEIMSRDLVKIKPNESLTAAWMAMHENDIKHLVVVEKERLCGVLSDRDILCELHFHENISQLKPNSVEYAMNPDVVTVKAEDPVTEVIGLMIKHKIHCVVAVDAAYIPVGIVTDFDLLCLFDDSLQ